LDAGAGAHWSKPALAMIPRPPQVDGSIDVMVEKVPPLSVLSQWQTRYFPCMDESVQYFPYEPFGK
jgi:hypothetical protein